MTELLDLAIHAHGGLELWREVDGVEFTLSAGGELWRVKGLPEGLKDVRVRVETGRPAVEISPFIDIAATGHFRPEHVWIETPRDGPAFQLDNPRASFANHTLMTPWSKQQELYFLGYALWNYIATPFLFTEPGFAVRELDLHEENGATWRQLQVEFPEHIPTHSHVQTLYFSAEGLLRRLDYIVDVAGGSSAAHYCFDHQNVGGFVIPTLRRVVSQANTPSGSDLAGSTGVLLQISDIVVRHGPTGLDTPSRGHESKGQT